MAAFEGVAESHWPAGKPQKMQREENFVKAPVWRLRFDGLKTPGRYRLSVAGVGRSRPFDIDERAWERAFVTKMRGLLHNRSGVDLAPPVSDIRRPRDFYPADAARVTRSAYAAEPGTSDPDHSMKLPLADSGEPAPEAWGGHQDAGDWPLPPRVPPSRHAGAARTSRTALQLLRQAVLAAAGEGRPAGGHQRGAVGAGPVPPAPAARRRGAQRNRDGRRPVRRRGELEAVAARVRVHAPDATASHWFAAAAARVTRLLPPADAALAQTYRDAAVRAIAWAEAAPPSDQWGGRDIRKLAALELARLTGDAKNHDLSRSTSCLAEAEPNLFAHGRHVQFDAAFAYARLPEGTGDAAMKARARAALLRPADGAIRYGEGNAFGLTHHDPGRPLFLGFFSTPEGDPVLTKAHFLTGDEKYLAAAVRGAQFSVGMNPHNGTYTTGLGANPPKNPLKIDARRTGQPAPAGLTVYGNVDYWRSKGGLFDWPITYYLSKNCTPEPYS